MYVMTYLKTKKQNALMSNTSANACRETNCTCYSFVTTKTPVITHRGFVFDKTSSPTGRGRIIRETAAEQFGRLAKRYDIELARWTICGAKRSVDGQTVVTRGHRV